MLDAFPPPALRTSALKKFMPDTTMRWDAWRLIDQLHFTRLAEIISAASNGQRGEKPHPHFAEDTPGQRPDPLHEF